MNASYADEVGGTGIELLVRDRHEIDGAAPARKPALERLEQSLGGPMTERLLCALAGDHRMRARDLPPDDSPSP
jgi:hypothetical protein